MTEIKKELKGDSLSVKAIAVSKLTYVSFSTENEACGLPYGMESKCLSGAFLLCYTVANVGLRYFVGGFQHHRSHEFHQVYLQGEAISEHRLCQPKSCDFRNCVAGLQSAMPTNLLWKKGAWVKECGNVSH